MISERKILVYKDYFLTFYRIIDAPGLKVDIVRPIM